DCCSGIRRYHRQWRSRLHGARGPRRDGREPRPEHRAQRVSGLGLQPDDGDHRRVPRPARGQAEPDRCAGHPVLCRVPPDAAPDPV
ncbi:MAG: 6-phosphogluconate dehydrogenase, decarboxylating, partial [uncultured Thermomicrobiales bacterium]